MSYQVGVDVGGTFTTTAVVRGGRAEVVSVVPTELPGVPRGFLRRIGDDTPVLVGTRPVPAEILVAQLVSQSVAKVGTPASLAVTHPVTWGPHRVAALRAALGEVTMLSSAAAIAYQSQAPTAVHDLGGTTFTAAVVRGLATVGQPTELDLGGADLDELVFEHVRTALGDAMPTDTTTLTRLRKACTAAKETLSADTEAEVPVANTRVRLTRAEFEEMARPLLAETAVALRMTIEESGVTPATVLLAGGAAWLPLLTQVVSEELGRPVVATPPGAAAMGAALAAAGLPAGPAFRNQAGTPGAGRPAALGPDTPSAIGAAGPSAAVPPGNAAFAASRPANPGTANPNTAGESDPNRAGALPYGTPGHPGTSNPARAAAPFDNPVQPNRATAAENDPGQSAPNRAVVPFSNPSQPNPNRPGVAGLPAASGPASPSATSAAGPGAATNGRSSQPTRLALSFESLPGNGSAFVADDTARTSVVEPVRPPVPFAAAPADGKSRRPRTLVAVAAAAFVVIGAASAIMLTSGQTPPGAGAETMPTTTTVTQTVSATTTTDTSPPDQTSTRQAPPSTRKTTPRPTTTTTKPAPTTTSSKAAPTTTTGSTTTTTTGNTPGNSRAPQPSQGGDD
jgi:molecular chaperone DnaK